MKIVAGSYVPAGAVVRELAPRHEHQRYLVIRACCGRAQPMFDTNLGQIRCLSCRPQQPYKGKRFMAKGKLGETPWEHHQRAKQRLERIVDRQTWEESEPGSFEDFQRLLWPDASSCIGQMRACERGEAA